MRNMGFTFRCSTKATSSITGPRLAFTRIASYLIQEMMWPHRRSDPGDDVAAPNLIPLAIDGSVGGVRVRVSPHPICEALSLFESLPQSVPGPSAIGLFEAGKRSASILLQRNKMATCSSLSGCAELGARQLESLNWMSGKTLNPMPSSVDRSYGSKCLDYCRRASGSLKSQEPSGNNIWFTSAIGLLCRHCCCCRRRR